MFQPDGSLEEIDPEIFGIIKQEKARQVCLDGCILLVCTACFAFDMPALCSIVHLKGGLACAQVHGLELIASENFTSKAVRFSRLRSACAVFGPRGHCAEGLGLGLCNY